MIHCRLHLLMAERRINISELHRETGISRTLLSLMYKDEVSRIDIESLDKLCDFFDCDVADILTRKVKAPV
ncbi:MAG: helix-turn-helix transcriptional regulator [Moraxellaceae bacterium]|nr:helix-turn-helix transcriptional regulator [Moraxellaceae bacterium]